MITKGQKFRKKANGLIFNVVEVDGNQITFHEEHYFNHRIMGRKPFLEMFEPVTNTVYKLVYYRNGKEEQTYIKPNGERTIYNIALDVIGEMVGHTDTSFGVYDAENTLLFSDEDINEN